MLTVTAFKIPSVQMNQKKHLQNFTASEIFSDANDMFIPSSAPSNKNSIEKSFPWLKDSIILQSINYLKDLEFDKGDIRYVQSLGAVLQFYSGKEAFDFINKSNVRIKFETLSSPSIHAQYDYEDNFIKINDLYKNTQNPAEVLAIAEAILHEVGHAKDKDGHSSIQEEINCLALNSVAHKALVKKYPTAFLNADSAIVKDGVCVYADLFFDDDRLKAKLVERIRQKYGFLPVGDFNHPPSALAYEVKKT